ncbi:MULTISPECIES: hypothetical protein [unclassified Gilliamella]|uniref:hypothetical protein n=1 Tax=unclassified Gilliamella TaxID=2685620 RepID=UPI0013057262|nr:MULTISPECIES: hypothetical protein [unclassified Gilliamella]MWP50355.1 hypothetical protein [Gilliamella sp. Lep-s35]MWP70068.1 hypothetical protein [Gilliamella sp. Lep-s5]MWP78277.1 hypothetical protein [Gilliamella sp. Lep-s21]
MKTKIIFYLLAIICVFLACKKEKALIQSTNIAVLDSLYVGDKNISNKEFINRINESCLLTHPYFDRTEKQMDIDAKNCILSKISYDYYATFHDSFFKKKIYSSNIELILEKKEWDSFHDAADLSTQINLITIKNHKRTDSLNVYLEKIYSEALTAKIRYFYLDRKLNLWLLTFIEDEKGNHLESWKKYKINSQTGKFELVDSIED